MFTQTWKKYLPIIVILLKRSVNGPQLLQTDISDFQRAAGGRKIKLSFSNLQLNNSRQNHGEKMPATGVDLVQVLLESETVAPLLKNKNFQFALGLDMQLTITNNTPPEETVTEIVAENTEALQA